MLSICLLSFTLLSCKDEFNIPETNSYVDGDSPEVTIVSPSNRAISTNDSIVPIHIEVTDNYFLGSFKLIIRNELTGLEEYTYETLTGDSVFVYKGDFTIPSKDSTVHELFVSCNDAVGNNNYDLISFTTK